MPEDRYVYPEICMLLMQMAVRCFTDAGCYFPSTGNRLARLAQEIGKRSYDNWLDGRPKIYTPYGYF